MVLQNGRFYASTEFLRSTESKANFEPKAKAPAKRKAAKPVKEAGDCHLSQEKKEAVTKAVRKLIDPKAAVEGIVRSSLNPKWNLYIWYGLDNGIVISVNIGKEVTAKYKEDDSWAVGEWKRIQTRRLRRQEKTAATLNKAGKSVKEGKFDSVQKAGPSVRPFTL